MKEDAVQAVPFTPNKVRCWDVVCTVPARPDADIVALTDDDGATITISGRGFFDLVRYWHKQQEIWALQAELKKLGVSAQS